MSRITIVQVLGSERWKTRLKEGLGNYHYSFNDASHWIKIYRVVNFQKCIYAWNITIHNRIWEVSKTHSPDLNKKQRIQWQKNVCERPKIIILTILNFELIFPHSGILVDELYQNSMKYEFILINFITIMA